MELWKIAALQQYGVQIDTWTEDQWYELIKSWFYDLWVYFCTKKDQYFYKKKTYIMSLDIMVCG